MNNRRKVQMFKSIVVMLLLSGIFLVTNDVVHSESPIVPPWVSMEAPRKGFVWLADEAFQGPCDPVSSHAWVRSTSKILDLFVHTEGPTGSGRYWTVAVGIGNKNDIGPSRGFCFMTSTVGWRTLREYKRTPLPWTEDLDGDGKPELIVWSSFPLSKNASYAEYGLMAWVYQVNAKGKFTIDWELSCKMARELAGAYRRSLGRNKILSQKTRNKIAEALESVAGEQQMKTMGILTSPDHSQAIGNEPVSAVVSGNNRFAIDLYNQLPGQGKNLFFSPWSIECCLSMAYEGARGDTAREMRSVLHIPSDLTRRGPGFVKLFAQINGQDKSYRLLTANALWAEQKFKLLSDFIATVSKYYGARVDKINFAGDPEGSRQKINLWVEKQTDHKIRDLLPVGTINCLTRLVLTNAVYFKGVWAHKFDESKTCEANFRTSDKKMVKVRMMSLSGEKFRYYENRDLQILELPYEGGDLSMVVILPKVDIGSLGSFLKVKRFEEWMSEISGACLSEVDVYLPKFRFRNNYMLRKKLVAMGMAKAFSDDADFSGMDGTGSLNISEVVHQVFVDVNEEGTEAAASTSTVTLGGAVRLKKVVFRADHPFIFVIKENRTDLILFMGKIENPGLN